MRFIVDGMLGSFSRWLRMLGCEVKYFNRASDDELLDVAKVESRVLLTRDLDLFRRAKSHGLEAFFVEGVTEAERLANFSRRFSIKLEVDASTSRCPTCNSSINRVGKNKVLDRVPPGTLKHYNEFWLCTGCGKVYWRGVHWKNINATLAEAKKILDGKANDGFEKTLI